MPRIPGTCEKCGADFIRMNKRRKYCTACQIIRDYDYRPSAKNTCESCGGVFYPARLSYTVCNPCREMYEQPEKYPPCKGCGRCNRPAPELTAYCMSCVQSSHQMRAKYVATIRKVVAERAAMWRANGMPRNVEPVNEPAGVLQ